jgi:hypothetical protein
VPLSPVSSRLCSEKSHDPASSMNQSQSYKGRRDKRWLSQLFADSAFPLLVLAIAVSQVKIGHHKKDALRHRDQETSEVQTGDDLRQSTSKSSSRAAAESSPFREKTGPDKKLADDQ